MNLLELLKQYQHDLITEGRNYANGQLTGKGVPPVIQGHITNCFTDWGGPKGTLGRSPKEYHFRIPKNPTK
jgi:hypothetical protein